MHKKIFLYLIFIIPILLVSPLSAAIISSNSVTGNWSAGSSWVGGVVPGINDDAIIVSGANITLNGNYSINSVQINGGGTFNASSNTLTVYGNWTINGNFLRGTSTVRFNGTGGQSMAGSGTVNFHHIIIDNNNGAAGMGVTAHTITTAIYGNFTQNGVFNRNFGKIIFGGTTVVSGVTSLILHDVDILSGAILNGATGISGGSSDIYFTGHWNNMGTFNPGTGTVNVQYSSSYATQNISQGNSPFYNLTINKNVNVAPLSNITVQNNFTIQVGNWNAGGFTLNVSGNFNNMDTFSAGTGMVLLNGTGNQNITTGGSFLYNFRINKSSGSAYQGSNIQVTNNLNLTSGILHTYTISSILFQIYISNNSGTSITGGSTNSFVVGNLRRAVIVNPENYNFPIGVINTFPYKYRPVTYNQNNSNGAAWVNMIADTIVSTSGNTADWFVKITTNTGNPSGTITMKYDLGNDFSSFTQECVLSIIRGQATPASNFNHILNTTIAPGGGPNGSITSELPLTLNPFGYIVGVPLPSSVGTSICAGSTATLSANFPTGSTHFNWYQTPTGGTPLLIDSSMFVTPNLYATTTYYLEYYNSLTNCATSRIPITVTVTPGPSSTFSLPDTVCLGENILVTFLGTISSTATYYWDFDGGILVNGSGSSNHEVYWNSPGFKNITLTVSDNPCSSILTLNTIEVAPTPSAATITPSSYAVCEGEEVTITASGSTGSNMVNYNFYDSLTGGNIVGISPLLVTPSETTTYYLEVINNYGCKSSPDRDSITIIIYPAPVVYTDYNEDVTICYGMDTSLYLVVQPPPAVSVFWWDSETGGNFLTSGDTLLTGTLYQDATFWVEAVTVYGCTNGGRIPVSVDIMQLPVSTIESNMEYNTAYVGQEVKITASPTTNPLYEFYVNNELLQSGNDYEFTTYTLKDGDVISILTETDQCRGIISDSIVFKIVPIANAFTPNGDGINDVFLNKMDLIIMNRWGQELYRGFDGWDGTFNGKKVSSGTYYYIYKMIGSNGEEILQNGALMLIE
ncbi:MAG: gliding motility-associated C-terminal domain-containing protein [Bacteroidota bacterium]|nr:gliding motility-associated C-terminal domain-containing protein [Bacteroidota bacterium]